MRCGSTSTSFWKRPEWRDASAVAADVMERANVRVVQAGDGLRLTLEPLLQIGIGGDMLGEDFNGHGAVQAGVAGFVDLAHAPRADGREDLVGAERRAG